MPDNKLQLIIEKSGLQKEQKKPLLDNFGDFFVKAHKLVTKSKSIIVTREDQIKEMEQARELRIQLKNLRNDANKVRVSLKEGYLRGGNAVQEIFNDIKEIIKPEEDRLLEQEKFIEKIQAERKEKEVNEKLLKISKYSENDQYTDRKIIESLSNDSFEKYLATVKTAFETKKAEEVKLEADRVAKVEAEREEQEKTRLENIRLKEEADAREKELAKERAEQQKVLEAERKLRAEADAKVEAERQKEQARLKEEADALDKKAEEEKQKLLAPDKNKLFIISADLEAYKLPSVSSNNAKIILNELDNSLKELSYWLNNEIKKL